MKSLSQYILEAKFMGFNADELKELEALKNDILEKNKDYLHSFYADSKRNLVFSGNTPIYGNKYLVCFKSNPLSNERKFSATPGKDDEYGEGTKLEKDEGLWLLGIADKFGRIFLYGKWDPSNPPFIQYKSAETKTGKNGKKYKVPAGWKFTKKDQEYYKVRYWTDADEVGARYAVHSWTADDKITKGIYDYDLTRYNDHLKMVFDLNDIPKKVQEILDEIERKAKEKAEFEEREAKRKAWQEELKNEWKCLGCANGWKEVPEIVKKAESDPDAKWWSQSEGRCYNVYYCDKYKIYYSVDSSD